jgi:hypothetical protein
MGPAVLLVLFMYINTYLGFCALFSNCYNSSLIFNLLTSLFSYYIGCRTHIALLFLVRSKWLSRHPLSQVVFSSRRHRLYVYTYSVYIDGDQQRDDLRLLSICAGTHIQNTYSPDHKRYILSNTQIVPRILPERTSNFQAYLASLDMYNSK